MPSDNPVHMTNQIAVFCGSGPNGARRTADVAGHVSEFRDPRPRARLIAKAQAGETVGMSPLVVASIPAIRPPRGDELGRSIHTT